MQFKKELLFLADYKGMMKKWIWTDIPKVKHYPLFSSMSASQFQQLMSQDRPLVADFSLDEKENQESYVVLHLFKRHLVLIDEDKHIYSLELTFGLKFQPIEPTKTSKVKEPIGFRLESQKGQTIAFYGEDSPAFTAILYKTINVKGFKQKFRQIKKIGIGRHAKVYEVQRIADKQRFAVKRFMKSDINSRKEVKDNLTNQIQVLRNLNTKPHPNVLNLQAVYESKDYIYVVLQLFEGKNLHQLNQEKILTQSNVKKIMKGLLSGVAHLCQNRVIHRDLKPANIMLRKGTLEPVIVDFGLSTNVDLPEYLFFRCGTPGYVAPEVIQLTESTHLEPTCDMFSLGAIFHLLLTGHTLFAVSNNNFDLNLDLQVDDETQLDREAYHLLQEMLIIDPTSRIAAEQALKHPYFNHAQKVLEVEKTTHSRSETVTSANSAKSGYTYQLCYPIEKRLLIFA